MGLLSILALGFVHVLAEETLSIPLLPVSGRDISISGRSLTDFRILDTEFWILISEISIASWRIHERFPS
jgi:hypothetical protein